MTNTADPRKTQYFPKFDWPRIDEPEDPLPRDSRGARGGGEERARGARAGEEVPRSSDKDDIAAFIIEPIQGEGGDNHFRPEFFRAVRQLCDENDMLLIFDEVQTGVGLTGKMWAFQQFGVEPDIFCFGKKTQVCGFASNDRIFDIDDNVFKVSSRINSTWGGNLTDMVRAQRYFEIIEEENLVENAAKVGAYFVGEPRARLSHAAARLERARSRADGCVRPAERRDPQQGDRHRWRPTTCSSSPRATSRSDSVPR